MNTLFQRSCMQSNIDNKNFPEVENRQGMSSSINPNWEILRRYPFPELMLTQLALNRIDSSRFITAGKNRIVMYDTNTNYWTVETHDSLEDKAGDASSCYDPISKQVFIPHSSKTISIFDLQTKKLDEFMTTEDLGFARSIWMEGCCHVIGSFNSASHHIWDNHTKQLRHIHTFSEFSGGNAFGLGLFGLIYIKRRRELLLFGGYQFRGLNNAHLALDMIYRYSGANKSWEKLDVKLPQKMYNFGNVMTKCQRFIIILGGNGGDFTKNLIYDKIFILESETMKISESKIKLPFGGGCRAVIMENKNENELLLFFS